MALPWIACRKGLARTPEVIGIAERLGVSLREAAGMCLEVWEWADDNTTDGHCSHCTFRGLDLATRIPGIADAMSAVRWLESDGNGGIMFPLFDRWNAESAKARQLNAERQGKHRKGRAT